jgi:hypothetical protein
VKGTETKFKVSQGETPVKKIFYSMLSVVLVLSALSVALPLSRAAELKPVVAVSFSGYSELMADIQAFGKLSGRPELDKLLEGMLAMVTQGKGLVGLDQKQPLGAVILSDGSEDLTIYGFLPVSDLNQLMELMKNPMTGESPKAEDGVYEIPAGPESVYVKQQGKWAYIVQKKETFAAVSNDPAALLGDLPKKYLLAVRATVKNIPDSLKQKGLDFLPMVMQGSTQPEMMKQNIEQMETLSKELDEVMLGVTLDRQTNSFYMDLELTAKPGTNVAAQLATIKPGKTDFAGLKIPGAAITAGVSVTFGDADVARAKKSFEIIHASAQEGLKDQDLSKEQLDLATDVLNELFDLAVKTIELKKSDFGMSLVLEPDAMTLVAGSIVADGSKLDSILKKLLAEAEKDEPDVAKLVKLNAETYKGVNFNTFSMPTPDPKLAALVGDTLDVVLGIGDKQVFIAAGRDAAKTLKEAIDKSQSEAGKEIPASQIVVSSLKFAKFVSAVADDDQAKAVADKVAIALEQSGGKDHLIIGTQPITNGARYRLELEEGILKALGGIEPAIMGQ